jgi:CubicO group peptidase (beta-lactamase class C family)
MSAEETNHKDCKVNEKVPIQGISELFDEIEAILNHWSAPGAVVSVVKGDAVLFVKGFGTTQVEGGAPIDGRTLTSVASVTKPFTAVAVGMLADDRLLKWDDPVKKYIPEFEFASSYRTENITIRDIMCHRSGLPGVLGELGGPVFGEIVNRDYSIHDLLAELPNHEPTIPFRDRIHYSQVGIALVGEIIGRVSGSNWSNVVYERILEPVGMSSSYPDPKHLEENLGEPNEVKNMLKPALRIEGRIIDGQWIGPADIYSSAAGLVTNGEDMIEFMRFLLNHGVARGRQLLSPGSLHLIQSPHTIRFSEDPFHQGVSSLINPLSDFVAYCLGWFAHEYERRLILEHSGANYGSSVVALVPEASVGVFVSSNATYSLDSDRMVSAIKFMTMDYVLDLPPKNWIHLLDAEDRY